MVMVEVVMLVVGAVMTSNAAVLVYKLLPIVIFLS